MNNIILVGFMGTGKTLVAKHLAQDLGMEYVSTDDLVEKQEGKPIKDIFKDDGEAYFREAEEKAVEDISGKTGCVVDTGGGVVLNPENMKKLGKSGTTICLWTDIDTIYERVKEHDHRPLMNVDDPKKQIKELLERRRPFYKRTDIKINTTSGDVEKVVESIKEALKTRSGEDGC